MGSEVAPSFGGLPGPGSVGGVRRTAEQDRQLPAPPRRCQGTLLVATIGTGTPISKRLNPTMTSSHLNIVIRPLAQDEAFAVSAWRYGEELAMYDGEPGQEDALLVMTEEGYGYYALLQNDELVGHCCFGPEGRVAGQPAPVDDLLDLGGGLRPDLVGKGLGALGLPVILAFARKRFSPQGFRTAIASFNRRSIVLCRWAGFRPSCTFPGPDGREFTELVLKDPCP